MTAEHTAADRTTASRILIPGPRSRELLERKRRVVPDAITVQAPVFAVRAEGALLWDADGRRYIDLAGGVGCLNVGHSHPRVVAAIQAQAARFTHTDFSIVPYQEYVTLAERLAARAPGAGSKRVAFFNSGAEAVENAVKVARLATGRPAVIAFEGAFHGRTYMALSLTSRVHPYKRGMGPFMPEVYRAPYPDPYRSPEPDATAFVLRRLEAMLATHVDAAQVAAVVVEPVLGEGGFIVPPPDFLPALRAFCDRIGALLVVDEVQTGLGRTGRFFAVEHAGIEPDLLVVGKSLAAGLPLSGLVGREEVFSSVHAGALGGTYPGNPLACAAALAVLEVMEEERLVERAQRLGQLLRDRLEAMARRYPLVGDVRGLGAMVAAELVTDRESKAPATAEASAVLWHALAQGVLLLRAGVLGNVIRFLMPLVISEDLLEEGLQVLDGALAAVQEHGATAVLAKVGGE
ncbi:MAG: 4-aminobutyrate--2-oxoglutarate transaminase [Armatimonadota bacterium]|nr:4-aminobutyrate--2-oxoglutarate transaminase [Armatimonadota bacterium]MDR7465310.1 4-aminobutyrate--2-oxoglutarate transaminase [Armatimonadota bacterium]MDR7469537.1 4-aminobutyrate--2-oxoglutarate transaminase [Armatimonadota bacterium]MDR7473455.1 4-aminobutyrate--2-oxoglutarate transaminase [Armatimonadota bacterium]